MYKLTPRGLLLTKRDRQLGGSAALQSCREHSCTLSEATEIYLYSHADLTLLTTTINIESKFFLKKPISGPIYPVMSFFPIK